MNYESSTIYPSRHNLYFYASDCLKKQRHYLPVIEKNENEIILGEDDKHLDFMISLLLSEEGKHLTISTTVIFKNWFGKIYFLPFKPFHKFIVPTMLKALIRN